MGGEVGDLPREPKDDAHLRMVELGCEADPAAGVRVNDGEKGVCGLCPGEDESVELVEPDGWWLWPAGAGWALGAVSTGWLWADEGELEMGIGAVIAV
jgi:hypothetical protein